MELTGQVAIVTGAGRGIGRATALELARMGADLVVAELDRAGAECTAAEVEGLGRRVSVVPTDVTRRTDLAAMTERTRAEFGRIDILVNNAGIYRAAAPLDVTEAHWDAVMNVNAKAVFFACQAVLPLMIAQKRGSIVSVASMAGKIGNRNNLPYNASKAAVIIIAALLYTHTDWLQDLLGRLAPFYPYAVFGAGVLLGWRFHRSRLLFALLVVTLADRTLVHFVLGPGLARDRVVLQAIGVLLPLNLAALSLTAERGVLTPPGLARFALILGQLALVAILDREAAGATAALLRARLL